MDTVRIERNGGIATIALARAERRNALDEQMLAEIGGALADVARDPDVAVVVLRAEGPAFTVGGDIQMFADVGDDSHDLLVRIGRHINPGVRALHESDTIAIAAVHGAVAGGGMGLMGACDLVLAAEGTTFALGYAAIATTPDAGTSYFLTRDVGYRRALELYLTNERFDAHRALDMGIVNRVVPADQLESDARALAERIAAGPHHALAQGKRIFRLAAHARLEHQLDDEIRTFADNTRHPAFAAAINAFLSR